MDQRDKNFAFAVRTIEQNVLAVADYRRDLAASPGIEMASMLNALAGGYVPPTSGGDLVRNPRTRPPGAICIRWMPSRRRQLKPGKSASNWRSHCWKHTRRPITGVSQKGDVHPLAGRLHPDRGRPARPDPLPAGSRAGARPVQPGGVGEADTAGTAGAAAYRHRRSDRRPVSGPAASRILLINQAIEMVAQLQEEGGDNYVRSGSPSPNA